MPSEIRHVLFRPAEVIDAIRLYHQRLGSPLPTGTVSRCGPETDGAGGNVRFRIAVQPDGSRDAASTAVQELVEVVVEGSNLAAALILYCRERQVPLPAGAHKSLQCFGEQVGLVATLNTRMEMTQQILRI